MNLRHEAPKPTEVYWVESDDKDNCHYEGFDLQEAEESFFACLRRRPYNAVCLWRGDTYLLRYNGPLDITKSN